MKRHRSANPTCRERGPWHALGPWSARLRLALQATGCAAVALAAAPPARAQERIVFDPPMAFVGGDEIDLGGTLPSPEQIATVEVDSSLHEVVARLDDPNFAERERATEQLRTLAPPKEALYWFLYFGELSTEQRYRVLEMLRDRLLNTPRGALGISMPPFGVVAPRDPNATIEIRVNGFVPGLPAERVLQIGDRIIEIEHKTLRSQQDLQMRIQAKQPGDIVHLKVLRVRVNENGDIVHDANNQPIYDPVDINMELGDAALLDEANQGNVNPQAFGQARFQNVSQSPVLQQRRREAAHAEMALAPAPTDIPVAGGASTLRSSGKTIDVDQHPSVQSLLRQRMLIAAGEIPPEQQRQLREQWEMHRMRLFERLQNPALSRDERLMLQQVIDRYTELMEL